MGLWGGGIVILSASVSSFPLSFLTKVSSLEMLRLGDPGRELEREYRLPRSMLLGDMDCLLDSGLELSPITWLLAFSASERKCSNSSSDVYLVTSGLAAKIRKSIPLDAQSGFKPLPLSHNFSTKLVIEMSMSTHECIIFWLTSSIAWRNWWLRYRTASLTLYPW